MREKGTFDLVTVHLSRSSFLFAYKPVLCGIYTVHSDNMTIFSPHTVFMGWGWENRAITMKEKKTSSFFLFRKSFERTHESHNHQNLSSWFSYRILYCLLLTDTQKYDFKKCLNNLETERNVWDYNVKLVIMKPVIISSEKHMRCWNLGKAGKIVCLILG